jgi:hypothetical protein
MLLIAGWYAITSPIVLLAIGEVAAFASGQAPGSVLSTKMSPGGIVVLVGRSWINMGLSLALLRSRKSAVGWSTAIASLAVLGAVLAVFKLESQDDLLRFAGGAIATAGSVVVLVYCRRLRSRGVLL